MKFVILKVILSITILTICINFILSTKTQTMSTTTLKTESQNKIGLNSNYKMTLGNLIAKAHKKTESNMNTENKTKNENSQFNIQSNLHQSLNSQIFFKGWIKYFKYTDNKVNQKPKQFFRNVLFEKDSKKIIVNFLKRII